MAADRPVRIVTVVLALAGACSSASRKPPVPKPVAQPSTAAVDPNDARLMTSLMTSSTSYKAEVRAEIAKAAPDSPAGLYSRAWLAGQNGKHEEALRLLRSCRQLPATYLPCFSMHPDGEPADERIAAEHVILSRDPSFSDYDAIRNTYVYLVELKHDQAAADAFLARWRAKVPAWVPDFIEGIHAHFELHDDKAAEPLLAKALAEGSTAEDAAELLTEIRADVLTDFRTDPQARVKAFAALDDFIRSERARPHPRLGLIADALASEAEAATRIFKSPDVSFQLYQAAFQTFPTGEAAANGFEAVEDPERGKPLLELATRKLPENPLVLTRLAALARSSDPDRAKQLYQEAIASARTLPMEWDAARAYAEDYLEDTKLDFAGAREIYNDYLAKGADRGSVETALYYNALQSSDFGVALGALADSNLDDGQKRVRSDELYRFLDYRDQAKLWAHTPFQVKWDDRVGIELVSSAPFAGGSVTLPASAIAAAAAHLSGPEARSVLFQVVVPQDDVGASHALKRAQGLVAALAKATHLPASHFAPLVGPVVSGPVYPSIEPIGDAARPGVTLPSAVMPESTIAASPDGRYVVVGENPPALWDGVHRRKLRNLKRGGENRVFSPSGRYLAMTSSYTEPGGYRSIAVYVYEAATGRYLAGIWDSAKDTGLAWSPDERRLAFVNEAGLLEIYDLSQRKRVASVKLPSDKRPVGLVWTPDSKYLVTAHADEDHLVVLDAATLRIARTLPGVEWVHALALTAGGRYLVAADNRRRVDYWDTATWTEHQIELPVIANEIAVDPHQPIIALNDFGGGTSHHLALVDLGQGKVTAVHDIGADHSTGIAFVDDGKVLLHANDDRIEILDGRTLSKRGELDGATERIRGTLADVQRGYLLLRGPESIRILNVRTGTVVKRYSGTFDIWASFGAAGPFLVATRDPARHVTNISVLDTASMKLMHALDVDFFVDAIATAGGRFALAGVPFGPPDTGAEQGIVRVYDGTSHQQVGSFAVPMATEYTNDALSRSSFTNLDLSADGSRVLVATEWVEGWHTGTRSTHLARLFDVGSGTMIRSYDAGGDVSEAWFDDDPGLVDVSSGPTTKVFKIADGTLVRSGEPGALWDRRKTRRGELYIADDELEVPGLDGRHSNIITGDGTADAEMFDDLNLLVTASRTGVVTFSDLEGKGYGLAIVPLRDGHVVARFPNGAVLGAGPAFWVVGDRSAPVSAHAASLRQVTDALAAIARHQQPTPPPLSKTIRGLP